MHRCHGLNAIVEGARAVTKLRATITQRFEINGTEFDGELYWLAKRWLDGEKIEI